MSGSDDNFLARWSRRKQDVKTSEQGPRHAVERAESSHGLGQVPPPSPTEEDSTGSANSPELSQPLPRIEDLTAESDVTAFLRAGVPQALRMAALRKAWSLDPAIRDYVGPSEYAHDFNNPAAIPGFGSGPRWDARTAAEYAQKIVNPSGAGSAPAEVSPAAERVAQPELDPVRLSLDTSPPPAPVGSDPAPPTEAADPPAPREESRAAEDVRPDPPASRPIPRHGGAIPR